MIICICNKINVRLGKARLRKDALGLVRLGFGIPPTPFGIEDVLGDAKLVRNDRITNYELGLVSIG